ncbi:MAG: glycosyltransferase family 4 protein [Halieaceae bacterium]|jgi:Fuc2NAc and GlcNAc transferase|nr:glycosyltransferase family 4 protein [Halieaceae bacterium]
MSILIGMLALVLSVLLTGLIRRRAALDVPNDRSAHTAPVPTGGGVGIVLGTALTVLLAGWLLSPWPLDYRMLVNLALVLMLLGWMDDRIGLPVWLRFGVYLGVCGFAVFDLLPAAPLWLVGLAGFYCLWMVNLFNFMDGIDGIAASEAVFVMLASAGLGSLAGASPHFVLLCVSLGAACLGFLYWNWYPARLFMGDEGSIPLGFLLAALALLGAGQGDLPLAVSLILVAVFVGDASLTLARRLWRRENVTVAHSQHAYQRLARYWGRHDRVVQAMTGYNLLWLLPLAFAALRYPALAGLCVLLAYVPLLVLLLKTGKLP